MKTKSEIFEDLCKYLILGVVGTVGIGATVFAVVALTMKIITNPFGVAVVLVTGAIFIAIGYGISLAFNALDRYACAKYDKNYEEEKAVSKWINRGVTTVEWPYIPDEKVKNILREYALLYDLTMDSTFTFSCVKEWLSEESRAGDADYISAFLDRYNLESDDTIKFWW